MRTKLTLLTTAALLVSVGPMTATARDAGPAAPGDFTCEIKVRLEFEGEVHEYVPSGQWSHHSSGTCWHDSGAESIPSSSYLSIVDEAAQDLQPWGIHAAASQNVPSECRAVESGGTCLSVSTTPASASCHPCESPWRARVLFRLQNPEIADAPDRLPLAGPITCLKNGAVNYLCTLETIRLQPCEELRSGPCEDWVESGLIWYRFITTDRVILDHDQATARGSGRPR